MALILGISRSTLVRIERGQISPKADIIKKLSLLSDKEISYFYNSEDNFIKRIKEIINDNNLSVDDDILLLLIKKIELDIIGDNL
ncbi:helix-turn-helix protein [Photobacterium malacitanum]|uniref:Helix-turn-helix protein n=2 Tax=Photobacterium malacitanum TaxID=2204294 RepID=A0A1Y6M6E1_9GAMM|nr:helix-turn-helix protein [Photobacterium malacitanum]